MNNLDEYSLAIAKLASSKSNFQFTNSGENHARIVMSNIFKTSEYNIKMFAGNLKGDVSKGDYLTALESFLQKKGTKLTVLLEGNPDQNSAAFSLIRKYQNINKERISISLVSPEKLEATKVNGQNNHFTIGDDRMFRFETDTQQYTAVCNFNDLEKCQRLNDIFNVLLESSTAIN
jgi:hypothetical protein